MRRAWCFAPRPLGEVADAAEMLHAQAERSLRMALRNGRVEIMIMAGEG